MVIITGIYVIATIFICLANIKAANASKEQLREMQKQFAETNRPVVELEFHYSRRTWYIARFVNRGNLSAQHVKINLDQEFIDSLPEESMKKELERIKGKEPITELSASKKLESLRAEGEHYLEQSFDPILAYGAHGAIVHYEPTEETDIPMEPRGLCLADTGAQYLEGTTDITRTIALGPLTDEEKRIYTLVLRGHIQLGAAKFLHGCMGENLDMLARTPLWEAGLDFNHGTGHGVGFVLGVHEGPERVHWDVKRQKRHCVIEEGMIFSNEPGIYLAGKFGVRIENLVVVREAEVNEYGRFLALEPLTLVPYDRDAIDLSLLSSRDVELLNAYHAKVFAAISPYLSGDELEWLKEVTKPVLFG